MIKSRLLDSTGISQAAQFEEGQGCNAGSCEANLNSHQHEHYRGMQRWRQQAKARISSYS
jgi:hypothetical protein